jgi:hypothetical protein
MMKPLTKLNKKLLGHQFELTDFGLKITVRPSSHGDIQLTILSGREVILNVALRDDRMLKAVCGLWSVLGPTPVMTDAQFAAYLVSAFDSATRLQNSVRGTRVAPAAAPAPVRTINVQGVPTRSTLYN